MKGSNFVSGLKAHFERAAPILPAVEMDYWRWIKKHAIKAPELEKLYDNLLESCKFMPSIEELTEHLHAIRSGQIKNAIFQVFTINGVRYARRVKTGESPSLPDGATDSKLAIPPELQAKQTREYVLSKKDVIGLCEAGLKAVPIPIGVW